MESGHQLLKLKSEVIDSQKEVALAAQASQHQEYQYKFMKP